MLVRLRHREATSRVFDSFLSEPLKMGSPHQMLVLVESRRAKPHLIFRSEVRIAKFLKPFEDILH